MLAFLQTALHKAAAVFTASLVVVSSLFSAREITVIPPVLEVATTVSAVTEEIKSAASSPIATTATLTAPQAPQKPAAETKTAPPAQAIKGALTAEQFLNRTQPVFKQRLEDGSWWLELHTDLSGVAANKTGKTDFKWDPSSPSIGGEGGIPKFDASFSCNPSYEKVEASIYSSYSFKIRTSYRCNARLTASSGESSQKEFNFTTGPGMLTVSESGTYSSTQLRQDLSKNALVFMNTDDEAATITGLVFDISAADINVAKPAVVRFADIDGGLLDKYFLEDMPKDSSKPNFYSQSDAQASFSLKIAPNSGKIIFIEARNIPASTIDAEANLSLVFTRINTDRPDMAIKPLPIKIHWACIVKFLPDNPDAMCR